MPLPDPQLAYYDALIAAAEKQLDADAFEWAASTEPESHDFYGGSYENGYDDPDEYRATVLEIGARDVAGKIEHWESAIASADDPSVPFRPRGLDPIQRAEIRAGA
jgi:hypothetical protein